MPEQQKPNMLSDVYANIVNFATTFWDLRLVFGKIIKDGEQERFESQAAITLPWLQAKVLSVYLQLNIFAYEKQYGKINVPSQFLPFLPPPDPETSDPNVRQQWEMLQKKLDQILATMEDLDPS